MNSQILTQQNWKSDFLLSKNRSMSYPGIFLKFSISSFDFEVTFIYRNHFSECDFTIMSQSNGGFLVHWLFMEWYYVITRLTERKKFQCVCSIRINKQEFMLQKLWQTTSFCITELSRQSSVIDWQILSSGLLLLRDFWTPLLMFKKVEWIFVDTRVRN